MDEVMFYTRLTPMFLKVPDGYFGFVAELPMASSLGSTLEETQDHLCEMVMNVLETDHELAAQSLQGQNVLTA